MIVLKSPKGWTGPKFVDGVPIEGTFRAHQVPLSDLGTRNRRIWSSWRSGCAATGRRSCSTRTAGCARSWRAGSRGRRGAWAPTPTPTAAAAAAICACPTSATTRVDVPAPGVTGHGDTRVLGRFLRDVIALNAAAAQFPALRARRDHLQRAGGASSRPPIGNGTRETVPNDEFLAPDGPGHGDAERAPVRGLAGGLPADRPARPVQLLRGLHPHHRLDVQPARQVAEGHRGHCRGGARSPR